MNGIIGTYILLQLLEQKTSKMSLTQNTFPTTLVMLLGLKQSRFTFFLFFDNFVSSKFEELVSLYESTSNAQKLFCDLVEHFTRSTNADIQATEILKFLADCKLGEDPLKHSTSEYIAFWVEQFLRSD